MDDQVAGAQEAGLRAAALHSNLGEERRRRAFGDAARGDLEILYVSPERLAVGDLIDVLAPRLGLIAVDEAHCVSHWGHDFRPEYRQLAPLFDRVPAAARMALTATATPQVQEDICTQLGLRSPLRLVGHPDRPNLVYRAHPRAEGRAPDPRRRAPPPRAGRDRLRAHAQGHRAHRRGAAEGRGRRPPVSRRDGRGRSREGPGRLRQRAAAGGGGDDRLRHGDRPLERALRRPRAPAALARALPAGIGARRARRAAGRVRAAGERRGSLPPQADGAAGRPAVAGAARRPRPPARGHRPLRGGAGLPPPHPRRALRLRSGARARRVRRLRRLPRRDLRAAGGRRRW